MFPSSLADPSTGVKLMTAAQRVWFGLSISHFLQHTEQTSPKQKLERYLQQ